MVAEDAASQETRDEAWIATQPFGGVVRDWIDFMARIIALNDLTHLSFAAVRPTMAVTSTIGVLLKKVSSEQKAVADSSIAWATHEIDSDFELTHALILMGAWGSFEAFVEDTCKARLMMEPQLLASKPFESLRIPAPVLVLDSIEQIDHVFSEAAKKLNADLKNGVGKFESLLGLVGLDEGGISPELKDAIFYAQQTRNVWAHRSGKADKRFIKQCPKLGLSVGDTVKISTEQASRYLHALKVYGLLVVNRFLAIYQINPMPFPGDETAPFAEPYAKLWGTTPQEPPVQEQPAKEKEEPVTGWWEEVNTTV